jgi:hypothetical protein
MDDQGTLVLLPAGARDFFPLQRVQIGSRDGGGGRPACCSVSNRGKGKGKGKACGT